jgi:hypothetical protein
VKVGDLVQLNQLTPEAPGYRTVKDILDTGVGLVTECTSEGSDGQLLLVYWHSGKREWLALDEVERINA